MDADLRPARPDESLGELAREASEQASKLVRSEVALAKVELREDIQHAVQGVKLFTTAGVTALLAVLMLSAAAGFGIGRAFGEHHAWLGFLIVGAVYLLVAGGAAVVGKKKTEAIPPPAPRATHQLKETAAAVKEVRR